MAARRGDEQGPFRRLLPLDLPEVRLHPGRLAFQVRQGRRHRGQGLPAGQVLHHLGQVLRGIGLDPLDHRGLRPVLPGDDQGQTRLPGSLGHGQHPPGRFQTAVQGQLPEEQMPFQGLRGKQALGRQDAHRRRQVEAGAILAHVRRRQIDGDAIAGVFVAGVLDRGPDPVLALFHRGLGQAHGGKVRQPRRQVDLHLHQVGVHPLEGAALHPRQHGGSPVILRAKFNTSILPLAKF